MDSPSQLAVLDLVELSKLNLSWPDVPIYRDIW